MNIDDMSLFVEVVKAKGFSSASQRLGIPTSTISVRINKLEQQLGLRLLNRSTRRVELTDVGQIYYERALPIVEESKALHYQLDNLLNQPTGRLRISMPVDFAYQVFTPLIPLFYQRYPQIILELDSTPRNVDLISEPFDLAICYGKPQDSNLIARLLQEYSFHLYASEQYLQQYGEPKTLDDLQYHHCLAFRQNKWQLFCDSHYYQFEFKPIFLSNSMGVIQRLTAQGMGIALLPDSSLNIQEHQQLKRIIPQWAGETIPLNAITSTRLLPKKVQVFIEFLKEHLAK